MFYDYSEGNRIRPPSLSWHLPQVKHLGDTEDEQVCDPCWGGCSGVKKKKGGFNDKEAPSTQNIKNLLEK